jgi:cytochrome P450
MRFFVTADPANVRHIFTSNHANYPKGEELAEIFDIVSGSILTVDGEACRQQRGMFQSVLSNPRVLELMSRCCRDKVVDGLLPFLARMERTGTPFDMQDLMTRLIFDLTATPIFGVDPGCLSTNMPSMHVAAAMDSVMEVGLLRHTVPASCWKMMRQLNLGPERKLAVAHTLLHGFIREMMEKTKGRCSDPDDLAAVDILSGDPAYSSDKALLSRILINYMIAGRDTVGTTLPWVFYNLAKNPRVVSGIREELAHIASLKASAAASNDLVFFESEETKDLVYLQAALFESLRLYPPGPFERKVVAADDVLPSGHRLCSGETILISIYSMGRMEALWGKDCNEYRPERWLSEDGGKLRYVPSHKFMAFNSGPRMCLGKDIAITQMKTIVAAVIWNFDLELLEGQSI